MGEPTTTLFTPTGKGIELVPVTHPNDLFAGETATFQFLLDGKPAAGLPVTVIPGGIRYRDQLNDMKVKTGADGKRRVSLKQKSLASIVAEWRTSSATRPLLRCLSVVRRGARLLPRMAVLVRPLPDSRSGNRTRPDRHSGFPRWMIAGS